MLETYGNYELIERLATGGMAEIFLARQLGVQGFEKELVIKRILPHLAADPSFVRMFLDEARIAARLSHPNIAQIYNLGAQSGTYFIAMEYLDGKDLRAVWKLCEARGAPMPPQHAFRVVAEAASALQHAHKRLNKQGKPLGIVHRDVSPQNIIVTRAGGIKVVDFGIAKAADSSEKTRAGVLKGKFAYMAPEQAAGGKVDRRADIFALGVVLHELLTGERLFKRDTDMGTLTAVSHCLVDPPSKRVPSLDDEVDEVVLKALQKKPADRYQEAEQLQLACENWLLTHKLPSGESHLAQFVAGLGADVEKKAAADRRKTGSNSKRSAPKPAPVAVEDDDEATNVSGPPAMAAKKSTPAMPRRRTEAVEAVPQQVGGMTRRQVGVFSFLLGVSAVAIIVLLGLMFTGSGASVRVQSTPVGASVFWNGAPVDELTPCTLPSTKPGAYWLEVNLAGYEPYRANITVPSSGKLDLAVVLKPL